jgi:hypothetical protein
MDKREVIILGLSLILIGSCFNTKDKGKEKKQDSFYSNTGGWDWVRIPLIKPYAAKKIDPRIKSNGWGIKLMSNLYQIDRAKKVSIQDSIIYVISGKISDQEDITAIGTHNFPTAWFIIDTKFKTEKGFPSKNTFDQYILNNGYPVPVWYDLDSLSNALEKGEKLPWFSK